MCGTDPLDNSDVPTDTNGDKTCDALEDDTDGDGFIDANDAFPLDKDEWLDTDSDGTGDNEDTDDDGDTWSDEDEVRCESDPLNSTSIPTEFYADVNCVVSLDETNDSEKETEIPEKGNNDSDNDSSSSNILWPATFCCLLLLLLLILP